jgi:hypothetical protein
MQYERMLRYHIAFHLPRTSGEMVIAEALDFPGAVTQGFDLADARVTIASAMEDLAGVSHNAKVSRGRRNLERYNTKEDAGHNLR